MKNLFRISGVILFVLSIFLIHSCKKDKPTPPVITTTAVIGNSYTTATGGGNITNDGGAAITARGVCWGTAADPTTALSTKTSDGTGVGTFTSSITSLTAGTSYFVRAYATNSAGTGYGAGISFSTTAAIVPGAPTIGTATAGNAQAVVTFTAPVSNGGSAITGYTVTSSPGGLTATGTASPITVTGLTNGTAYTFKVTVTNAIGNSAASSASNSVMPVAPSTVPGAPTIGTAAAGSAQSTVTFTAPVSNGGSAITGYTVTSSPVGITANGTASPITVTGLTNGTAYTFTVTATNAIGTSVASSASNSVTPTILVTLPTLTTTAASLITQTTATSGGNISSDGGASVTARGVCWSNSANPTTALTTKTSDGTGTGVFTSSLTGLTANTTYYVRAYATNSIGTAYGDQISFTTQGNPAVNINNTTWDVTIYSDITTSWHADVTFNADGTTKYDEPESPGVYLSYGLWSLNSNQIHWDIGMSGAYVFDGTVNGNTMSGTYLYGTQTKTWSAIKR